MRIVAGLNKLDQGVPVEEEEEAVSYLLHSRSGAGPLDPSGA